VARLDGSSRLGGFAEVAGVRRPGLSAPAGAGGAEPHCDGTGGEVEVVIGLGGVLDVEQLVEDPGEPGDGDSDEHDTEERVDGLGPGKPLGGGDPHDAEGEVHDVVRAVEVKPSRWASSSMPVKSLVTAQSARPTSRYTTPKVRAAICAGVG
jgi:hypothetical protein